MAIITTTDRSRVIPYRAEVDGLRAIAVVAVILFHAHIPPFTGGYVGVDIFFVISGYLITSIIAGHMVDRRFSIVDFYGRRVRRILPAMFFYVAIAAALTIWLYPPHLLKDFGQSVVANSIFASNIFFYIETDYWNDFAETAPLLHTWSLAVEEQYYMIVPVLLMVTIRKSATVALCLMIVMLLASLLYSQFVVTRDGPFAFYMVFTRFWELAAGGCLALANQRGWFNKTNDWLAAVGLALCVWAIFAYDSLTLFPGLTALAPVGGTVLLIAFAREEGFMARILRNRWFVGTGLISYSWYLSHHIIFAVARAEGIEMGMSLASAFLIAASFLLALFSYFLIERPARHATASLPLVFSLAVVGSLMMAGLGYYLHKSDGLQSYKIGQLAPEMRARIIDFDREDAARKILQAERWETGLQPFNMTDPRRRVLVIGDSKAMDFYVSSTTADFAETQFRFMRLNDDCMASRASEASGEQCAAEWAAIAEGGLLDQSEEVLLTATWQYATINGTIDFIRMLTGSGKAISLASTSNFSSAPSLNYIIARRGLVGEEADRFLYENIRNDWHRQYLVLKAAIESEGLPVRFLEKLDVFCDLSARRCKLQEGDKWLIFDSGHLTVTGHGFYARRVKDLGWYR